MEERLLKAILKELRQIRALLSRCTPKKGGHTKRKSTQRELFGEEQP